MSHRLAFLTVDDGPSPHAFNFATAFDTAGSPHRVDPTVVKAKASTLTSQADPIA